MSAQRSGQGLFVRLLRPATILAIATVVSWAGTPLVAQGELEPFTKEVLDMRAAARNAGVPETDLPMATPEQIRASKPLLRPWERKLDSTVRDRMVILQRAGVLADGKRNLAREYSTGTVLVDDQARLRVECQVNDVVPFDEAYFQSIGGELVQRAFGYGFLVAWIPAERMEAFASRVDVRQVQHIDPPFTDLGLRLTEGDAIHNADDARTAFGISGAGLTVGVISDGVAALADSQASGDLPAVTVPAGCTGAGDEGTAMLEIVADLAPGAALAFCTGFPGTTGMINAINTLAGIPGMDVISDDLPHPQEPLFEDGPIAQAKQAAYGAGIFYTASAGNRGNQHYEGNFNSPTAGVVIGPNTYSNPHDFGSGDVQLGITLAGRNSVYLQWAEPFGSAGIDLDLYVVDSAGNVLASSTNTQDGDDDPAETVSFIAIGGTAANIVVDYVGGGAPPTVFFDLRGFDVAWNQFLVRAGSLNGASRQPEVYAAAAADQAAPGTINGFSSRGPITRFFPGPPITRVKPDGTCVDGVQVTGAGDFGAGTCPVVNPGDTCRFGGTSASTPHVAGLAALLLESEPALTPAQIAAAFNGSAVDIDAAGLDNNAGWGRLDVFAAICLFDDVPPQIFCPADITVECTGSCGVPATDAQLAAFFGGVSATDVCDSAPTIAHDAPGFLPVGATVVTFVATDDLGNSSSCQATITVQDTIPPEISVELNRYTLWPPNHKMVAISSEVTVTDICDPNASFWLASITSDEPDNGLGDGDTAGDVQGAEIGEPDTEFQLRSERSGLGDGRTYTIFYTAYDSCDTVPRNTTDTSVAVDVPHDQSGHAKSSTGFNATGTGLQSLAQTFQIVLLSEGAFDATTVDPTQIQIGTTAAVIDPLRVRTSDVNCDGRLDVTVTYAAGPAKAVLMSSEGEPLALRYETVDGTGYLVGNVFTLGSPIMVQTCQSPLTN